MYKPGFVALFIVLTLVACGPESNGESTQVLADLETIEISAQFDPFTGNELDAFRSIVGGARIVALGQSRHDTHEQLEVQAMLSKNLIGDFGFKVVILEESFTHCLALDAYVRAGEGDLRTILNGLAGWYLWDSEEMVAFFEWVRRFNATQPEDERIRVFGMDITAPALGIRRALAVAESLDGESGWAAKEYGLDLHSGDMWPRSLERYSRLSSDEVETIGQNLTGLGDFLDTRADAPDASSALRLAAMEAEIGSRAHEMFSASGMAEIGAARENGMAATVDWILGRDGQEARAIIWTHNLHAARSSFRMPQIADGDLAPMGILLGQTYGTDYVSIGASFGSGEFPESLPPGGRLFARPGSETVDGAIAEMGHEVVLLGLTGLSASSTARQWLSAEREWRMQDVNAILSPAKGFDAIYYVDKITRAELTPLALERHARDR